MFKFAEIRGPWIKALLLVALMSSVLMAHPHVFVDATVKAKFSETGFSSLLNHWVYDEIYSAAMFAGADEDKDGKLSEKEVLWLKDAILGPLAKSNYYNYVLLGTDFLRAKPVKKFSASLDKRSRLVLDFETEFSIPVTGEYTMFVVVVADPSNYIQMTTDMENADVDAPDVIDVDFFNDAVRGLSMFKAFRPEIEGLYVRFKK